MYYESHLETLHYFLLTNPKIFLPIQTTQTGLNTSRLQKNGENKINL